MECGRAFHTRYGLDHLVCPLPGQLDQAATWLLENAETMVGQARGRADPDSASHSSHPLSGVEIKAESVCICFIDDCLDCDVPLAEFTFSRQFERLALHICGRKSPFHVISTVCFGSLDESNRQKLEHSPF